MFRFIVQLAPVFFAKYNMELRVPFVIISNGITTHGCKINFEKNDFELIERIPDYSELEF